MATKSACLYVWEIVDDLFIFAVGAIEISAGFASHRKCLDNLDNYANSNSTEAYERCVSFSVFGMLFGVAAMVFAIFSFLLEVCPDECGGDGDCCTRQRVAERLVCQRCAANTEPDDDKVKLKAKDVAKLCKTFFTALTLGLLLGAQCNKDGTC